MSNVEGTSEGAGTGAGTGVEKPAWIAQLPSDLKDNEAFTAYKTIGDLAKTHLDYAGKVKELDGVKAKLDNYIPKLSKDATDEQRAEFRKAIGVPDKADNYEFLDKDGKPSNTNVSAWAKQAFFKHGVPADVAKGLSNDFDAFLNGIGQAEVQMREKARGEAETKLKAELGDKYDASVEMVRRVWKKLSNSKFDAFVNETKIGNDPRLISFIINIAKLTGEDKSPAGSPTGQAEDKATTVIKYDKTPPINK